MDEYKQRLERCLYQMRIDEGNDIIRPKYWARILEGKDTTGKGLA